jgi:hypothetical protein
MRCACAVLLLGALALPACSSDAVPEPEPTLETPGAFVALREDDGSFTLNRTLDRFLYADDTFLFFTVYDVEPTSFDDAREIAKRPYLPVRTPVLTASGNLFSKSDHRVVWFRSLTPEELERLQ